MPGNHRPNSSSTLTHVDMIIIICLYTPLVLGKYIFYLLTYSPGNQRVYLLMDIGTKPETVRTLGRE
jgi:hypothetical protein